MIWIIVSTERLVGLKKLYNHVNQNSFRALHGGTCCNPSIQEEETEGSQVQDQAVINSKTLLK